MDDSIEIEVAVPMPRGMVDVGAKTLLAQAIYNTVDNITEHPQITLYATKKGRGFISVYKSLSANEIQEPGLSIARRWATGLKSLSDTEIKVLMRDFHNDVYINTDESGEYFYGRVMVRLYIPRITTGEDFTTYNSEDEAIKRTDFILRTNGFLGANSLDEANRLAKEWGGWVKYHFFGYRI